MTQSDVTVVIPAYNVERYVATAIESALAQSAPPREVIVVDDGSKDGTRQAVERFGARVRYVFQQNSGVSAARNNGIESSKSRYVAFLDADDAWLPNKLERQIAGLNGCRASYTAHLVVDDDMQPLFENRSSRRGTALEDLLTIGNVVGSPSSVLVERAVFGEVGGFDSSFSTCADWEMWIRIATRTDFAYVDEPLVRYRLHCENMSRNVPLLEDDSVRTLEKAFDLPAVPPALRQRRRAAFARNRMVMAGSYLRAGRPGDAVRCAMKSIAGDPRQIVEVVSYPFRVIAGRSGERSVSQR